MQKSEVGVELNGPGDASGVHLRIVSESCRKLALKHHIAYAKVATRLENAVHFLKSTCLIRHQIKHAVADNHVGAISRHWYVLDVAKAKLNVVESQGIGIDAGLVDHLGRHVDADDLAFGSGDGAGNKGVVGKMIADRNHGTIASKLADAADPGRAALLEFINAHRAK